MILKDEFLINVFFITVLDIRKNSKDGILVNSSIVGYGTFMAINKHK